MPSTAKITSEFSLSPSAAKLRLLKKLRCTLRYEKGAWAAGAALVAGVDEVGRGSLFGPVVAAAVILERGYRIRGLRDSKLLLPERRELLAPRIREHAVAWAVVAVDAARIDQINIY
ncbi:MAG: ribonuclease HII, partial [Candidatus Sulfotelmatobacter sp.]